MTQDRPPQCCRFVEASNPCARPLPPWQDSSAQQHLCAHHVACRGEGVGAGPPGGRCAKPAVARRQAPSHPTRQHAPARSSPWCTHLQGCTPPPAPAHQIVLLCSAKRAVRMHRPCTTAATKRSHRRDKLQSVHTSSCVRPVKSPRPPATPSVRTPEKPQRGVCCGLVGGPAHTRSSAVPRPHSAAEPAGIVRAYCPSLAGQSLRPLAPSTCQPRSSLVSYIRTRGTPQPGKRAARKAGCYGQCS